MPGDQPRPPNRAWRNNPPPARPGATPPNPTAGPSSGPGASGGAPAPGWRGASDKRPWKGSAATGPRQPWSRQKKLFLAAAAGGGLLGFIVLVILWIRPAPKPSLILLGAGNETNLAVPHNVPGKKGLAALAKWADGRADIHVQRADLDPDLKGLDQLLDGRAPKALALFLAVHGGADSDGLFLVPQLPQDAEARDRTRGRVRLTDVLDRLKK